MLKALLRITGSKTFFFTIQVLIENKKTFDEQVRLWPVYQKLFSFPTQKIENILTALFNLDYKSTQNLFQ